MFAYFRAPLSWTDLAKRTVLDIIEDGCPGLAAQLAFYFFLAVFPALLFIVSLLAYLPIEPALDATLERLGDVLPQDVLSIVRQQIDLVLAGGRGGLLTLAVAGAIWSSSSAMMAIIYSLNRAYDIEEFRPWWHTRLLAIGLTLALSLFVLLAFTLVVGGADLGAWAAARVGAGDLFERVWAIAQWPVALALVVFAVDLVYYFAPNADTEWVWVTPGALLATGLWLLTSVGFRFYVREFSDYGAVYGAIGGVIVLLLWFYLSGFALLVGAELNAEIDRALPTRDEAPQAPDRRKKIGPAAERKARAFLPATLALALAGGGAAAGAMPGSGAASGRIYVSNEGDGTVSVIDAATDEVVDTIDVGSRPRGIQAAPDGGRVYVALSDIHTRDTSDADAIAAIDTATGRIAARYRAGSDPEQFAISPDGRTLYASNEDAGTASITDIESGRVLATLAVGIEPEGVAISPDGRWVYVTAETSNTVSVIDTRVNDVVASFLVDPRPRSAAFAPDGLRAYVTAEIGGTVSVVDAGTHRVEAIVDALGAADKPMGVVVSPDSRRIYVTTGHGHHVEVIDARTLALVARVAVGKRPWGIAQSADGARLYTANGLTNDVSVVDAATLRVVRTIPVGTRPWGVAVIP